MSLLPTLALVVGTSSAPARDPVLVLELDAGETITPDLAVDLQARLERGIGRGRMTPTRDAAADACTTDGCVRSRAAATRSTWVLRSTVWESDRNFAVELRLLDAETLDVVAQSRRECEVCGSAEVLELLEDQAAALAARPTIERPVLGALLLRSRPAQAKVTIDGEHAGSTPSRHEVSVGKHRVTFALAGYGPLTRDVVATAGVEELVEVELVRRRRPLRIAGAVLLGVGLGATAAGGTLLGLDQRPYRSRCSGDDVDFAGRCRFRLDTMIPGAATTAVGLAAVVTGTALLIAAAREGKGGEGKGRRKRRPQ